MNLQLQDCRICRGVIRIHRHGHELCCSAEQSDALQWGMEGQWVDNAIWADTVTRSTLHSGRNQGFLSNGCIGCIYLVKTLAHCAMLQCMSRYNKPP